MRWLDVIIESMDMSLNKFQEIEKGREAWHAAVHMVMTEQLTLLFLSSVQFSSVIQSCPTLCNPMDHSTPGFPVHYQHLELMKTHVHRVGDAIQPSHPLSSPSPPTFNLSQPQGLFQ